MTGAFHMHVFSAPRAEKEVLGGPQVYLRFLSGLALSFLQLPPPHFLPSPFLSLNLVPSLFTPPAAPPSAFTPLCVPLSHRLLTFFLPVMWDFMQS